MITFRICAIKVMVTSSSTTIINVHCIYSEVHVYVGISSYIYMILRTAEEEILLFLLYMYAQ